MTTKFPLTLADHIARARSVLFGTATESPSAPSSAQPDQIPLAALSNVTTRPTEPTAPKVLPTYPSAATVAPELSRLTKGARVLFDLLHKIAVDSAKARGYAVTPSAVTFHLPAVAVALYLNYTERHLYRLADELAAAGLIAGGGHAQRVDGRSLYDGTLWKVRTVPGHVPRVTADEWKHDYRPDFAADYYGKKGAAAEMAGLLANRGKGAGYDALLRRAAVQGAKNAAVASRPDYSKNADLHSIAADLPALVHIHPKERHAAVTRLASRLCHALNEPERFKQWCRALYAALNAENQMRPGLSSFALQLTRLAADLADAAPWKRPGAVLTSRL